MDNRSVCSTVSNASSAMTTGATEKVRAITSQAWPDLGSRYPLPICGSPTKTEDIVERVWYILLVRIAAVVTFRDDYEGKRVRRADDLDLSTIDRIVPVNVQRQLFEYLEALFATYREVYYHSIEHAYHVVVSANKLLDMLLQRPPVGQPSKRTFGIRNDPSAQLALIFAAVIHDADHQGVSNAQLVQEEDELAIMYNDQSVAEQHSLALGFRILSQKKFKDLKETMVGTPTQYRAFRKTVIDLVLCTDIASPDRTQIANSKWKEAFGDAHLDSSRQGKRSKDNSTDRDLQYSDFERNAQKIIQEKSKTKHKCEGGGAGGECNKCDGNEHQDQDDGNDVPVVPPAYSDTDTTTARDEYVSTTDDDDTTPPVRLVGGRTSSGRSMRSTSIRSNITRMSALSALSEDAKVVQEMLEDVDDMDEEEEEEEDAFEEKNETVSRDSDSHGTDPEVTTGRRYKRLSIIRRCSSEALHNGDTYMDRYTNHNGVGYGNGGYNSSNNNYNNNPGGLGSDNHSHDDTSASSYADPFRRDVVPRRSSAPERSDVERRKPRELRLGVRLAIDLTGCIVDVGGGAGASPRVVSSSARDDDDAGFDDEPDDFRASVALETMMRAADVSPPMQDWNRLQIWCSRLFFEQKRSFEAGRNAVDPAEGWFDGQIDFMDFYVIPLARKLDVMGVFGNQGQQFASFAEENLRLWLDEGDRFTKWMVKRWDKIKDCKT